MGDLQLGPAEPLTHLGHARDPARPGVEEHPEVRNGPAGRGRHRALRRGGGERDGRCHRCGGRWNGRGGGDPRGRRSRRERGGRDSGTRRSGARVEPGAGRQSDRRDDRRREDGGRPPGPGPALSRSHARSFPHCPSKSRPASCST
ncbi:hypothetical protein SHJG_4215 [Streptomyces hygroscopicus subsp. jinggangensis 5008]|nr:hypothetical protein SHJG_4215 [Streptomyces hygroscopicus subsp. jinggangensis 5008]AGF63644.1 hypothetical protein SHJGH_3979 [Streptomyces hygroscopicus subsp. jinggangensis TL01]